MLFAAVLTFGLAACTESYPELSENGIPSVSAYEDAIDISIDDTINQVTFTLNSKGCMPLWIFDGKTYSTVNGLKRIYAGAGEYSVDVKIVNANGSSDGYITKTFIIENSIIDESRFITLLSGGDSKEWRIAKDVPGHMGCGPSGTDGTEWWSAAPEDKKDWGVYDDVLTFTSDKHYTYNPGEGGTVYVNTGVGLSEFKPYDSNDGNDYMAPVESQTVEYDFAVSGEDLYLVLPSKTLFPYIPYDDSYNSPKFKIVSLTTKQMELIADNGDIAWHFTLTSEAVVPEFNGFKYDSEFNMWKDAIVSDPVFWYAPGWNQIADPEYTLNGNTYTVSLPEATTDKWQSQMALTTNISTTSASNYDFSVILSASQDHNNVTVKLTDADDDGTFYFDEVVSIKAYEDVVFWRSDMPGLDIASVKLVFDFGGNAAGTDMTISSIVLKDHANDDGTVLPSDEPAEPEEDVIWNDDDEHNFWRSANMDIWWYYAPGWAQLPDPEVKVDGGKYTFTLPTATTDQWQAQMALKTDLSTTSEMKYDFRCTLNTNQDLRGVTVKLVLDGDDNNFYFTERVDVPAYEDYVFKMTNLDGIDMDKVNLFFDFGGNPDNTEVTISDIILQKHNSASVDWDEASAANLWNGASMEKWWYYAPGWAQLPDPDVTEKNGVYTIVLPTATTDQWQAQMAFKTDISTSADKNYDFRCILNANFDLKGVTVKLVVEGDDNNFYFADRVDLTAYEDYTFQKVNMAGIDMDKVNLFFDFGGNPDNTEIVISGIILQEHQN